MQQLLKQAQKMQEDMLAAQESLKDETVEASAGGGMVTVEVTGDLDIKSITIDPEAVDPEDVELLAGHGAGGRQRGPALGPGAGGVEDGRDRRRARRPRAASASDRPAS